MIIIIVLLLVVIAFAVAPDFMRLIVQLILTLAGFAIGIGVIAGIIYVITKGL
jgi:hypothetical protein